MGMQIPILPVPRDQARAGVGEVFRSPLEASVRVVREVSCTLASMHLPVILSLFPGLVLGLGGIRPKLAGGPRICKEIPLESVMIFPDHH